MIILDFASATTCKNDKQYVKRMIDELKAVDSGKHEVVIKWQLFTAPCEALDPPVVPLDRDLFEWAYNYAAELGYKTTASVFDKESLDYLSTFDIPFVKLANRPDLYWLVGEVPKKTLAYVSVKDEDTLPDYADEVIACVSKYPATIEDYEKAFSTEWLEDIVSDHTTDFKLWHKYKPHSIEWHYKLSDSTGYDAGEFARTPEQLKEIL